MCFFPGDGTHPGPTGFTPCPPKPLRRRRVPGPLLLPLLLLALAPTAFVGSPSLGGQTLAQVTATPDSAAALFLRSVRAIRWGTAAQFMDSETLERFKTTARMMAAADVEGRVSRYLVGSDSVALTAMEPAQVFERSVGAIIDDMPGLMHSLYDRDDEVLGHVLEGTDTAHVVYRTTARLQGAVPEVKVMQLRRAGGDGWRVLWSDELEVLEAALRGAAR